jgi:hypothetical protein
MKYRNVRLARHGKCAAYFKLGLQSQCNARDFHDLIFAGRHSRNGGNECTQCTYALDVLLFRRFDVRASYGISLQILTQLPEDV